MWCYHGAKVVGIHFLKQNLVAELVKSADQKRTLNNAFLNTVNFVREG